MTIGRSRQDWLTLFETAAAKSGGEMNEHWDFLRQELRLQPAHYLAFVETLRQGRWRTAENPKAYVNRVTRFEAFKMKAREKDPALLFVPDDPEGEEASGISALLDRTSFADSYSEPMRSSDGVWRPSDQYRWYGNKEYEEDDEGNPVETYREHLLAKIPGRLKNRKHPTKEEISWLEFLNQESTDHYHHAKPRVRVDWKQWGEQAGLSIWEVKVLQCRAVGVSREAALAKQLDEKSKRALQAAWRKFDRTGKELLRAIAEKTSKLNVPERAIFHTS